MVYSDIKIDKAQLSLVLWIYLLVLTTKICFLETNLTTWSFTHILPLRKQKQKLVLITK